ncbi:hypothetical protein AsAng_0057070 [Aureispira anguillae]|uniref:Uncharacterized protein n=1 Tax=Aureispira anguillae TaxID=2864201 RepID=A0A915YKT9_9BACT|nr:hypothetical protein AsAng_0057070 [Aureispira anguillae]
MTIATKLTTVSLPEHATTIFSSIISILYPTSTISTKS